MINYNITFLSNLILYGFTKLLYMNIIYFIYGVNISIICYSFIGYLKECFTFIWITDKVINMYADNFENHFVIITIMQSFISSVLFNFSENRNNHVFFSKHS